MGRTYRNQTLIGYARHNRQTLNDAETRIWSEFRGREFGIRFRRQSLALSDPDMVIRTISAVVEELLEKQTASR